MEQEGYSGAPKGATGCLPSTDVFVHRADHDARFLLDWPGFGGKMVGGAQCRIGLTP